MTNYSQPSQHLPLEIQTRFLISFQAQTANRPTREGMVPIPLSVDEMVQCLLNARFDPQSDAVEMQSETYKNIWEATTADNVQHEIHEFYRQELLDTPLRFLFDGFGPHACRFLRITKTARNKIFHNGLEWLPSRNSTATDSGSNAKPRMVTCPSGVELWLMANGLGILSITLGLKGSTEYPLSTNEICYFNYSLSQRLHRPPANLRQPPSRLQNLPSPTLAGTTAFASTNHEPSWHVGVKPVDMLALRSFMADRIGKRGGEYTLEQMRAWLLLPLLEAGFKIQIEQNQFSIYTTALFDQDTAFVNQTTCDALAPTLSALAQLEEPSHAGTPPGEVTVPNAVLNSCHWAAAGCQGAAHLVTNQGIDYDSQRMHIVREKYFLPWLLAWMQDLILQNITRRSADMVRNLAHDRASDTTLHELDLLRREVLEFDAVCFLNRVSARAAHNRWYHIAQSGFDVAATFEDVKRGTVELDALTKLHVQQDTWNDMRQIARASGENVHAIKVMQSKVEWVEIFLVAVYSVYLVHYVGEDLGFPHAYMGLGIVLGSLISSCLAAIKLKPWEHDPGVLSERPNVFESLVQTRKRFLIVVLLLMAAYIILGLALREPSETLSPVSPGNYPTAKNQ